MSKSKTKVVNNTEFCALTTKEAAKVFGVNERTVRKWIENGDILSRNVGSILGQRRWVVFVERQTLDLRSDVHMRLAEIMSENRSHFMRTAEAAELFGVNPRTVRRWIEKGRIKAIDHGNTQARYLVKVNHG